MTTAQLTLQKNTKLTVPDQLLVDSWLANLLLSRSTDTVDSYRYGFRRFRRMIDAPLLSVTPEMIEDWLIEMAEGRSRSTIELWYYAVRSFYHHCVRIVDFPMRNPTDYVQVFRQLGRPPQTRTKALSVAQLVKLLDCCNESYLGLRDRAILSFAVFGSLRQTEIARLRFEDLLLENDRMRYRVQLKGHRDRNHRKTIPNPEVEIVNRYVRVRGKAQGPLFYRSKTQDQPMTREHMYDVIKDRFIAIGVDAPPHSLRKSAATLFSNHNIPLERGAEQLGHSSIETTRRHYIEAQSLAYPTEDVLYDIIMRKE